MSTHIVTILSPEQFAQLHETFAPVYQLIHLRLDGNPSYRDILYSFIEHPAGLPSSGYSFVEYLLHRPHYGYDINPIADLLLKHVKIHMNQYLTKNLGSD